jgi:hypothetical protein
MTDKENQENIIIEEDIIVNEKTDENQEVQSLPTTSEIPEKSKKVEELNIICSEKPKKKDRRAETSRQNIVKAREAKRKKYLEQQTRMRELFSSSSDSDSDSDTSDSESSDDDIYKNSKAFIKRESKQQKEINELKNLLFKLAKKQKKYRKKKKRSPKPQQGQAQPVIHYNIAPPPQPIKEEPPKKKQSIFMQSLRNKIIDE